MVVTLQQPTLIAPTTLRVEVSCSTSSSTSANPDDFLPRKTRNHHHNHLSLSKPAFIIRTESNVRKMNRRKPEPSCVVCEGSGRVDCHHCQGKGRTNNTELMMLPKGEWPKWCKTCGGSGLGYCRRCLGTGEYRDIMGFHFMKMKDNHSQKQHSNAETDRNAQRRLTPADLLLSETYTEEELEQLYGETHS